MKQKKTREFGLLMAIAMIVGIVIGSGIFFKADDILVQTNGDVFMGCIVLILGAFGIIFGGLTIAEWAKVTDDAGGLISYGEKAFGTRFAFLIGWFQATVYFPALVAVVCWVGGNYTIMLFPQITFLQDKVWVLAIFYICLLYFMNTCSIHIAGKFQTSAMFIKLVPLAIIATLGIVFGDASHVRYVPLTTATMFASAGAIVSVAFSYDGWSIAPSICHEIKNAKRNLPLALTIAPILIMLVYLLYFLGINFLIGPKQILALGDDAFLAAAIKLCGDFGARLLLVCVVISILGTANGIALGSCRIPHALALRKELPCSEKIAEIHPRLGISIPSCIISFLFTLCWLGIHFITIEIPSIAAMSIDVSSIPIVLMYVFYSILYIGVVRYAMRGNIKSKLSGYLYPMLAIIGAAIVIYGGLQSSNAPVYLGVSFLVLCSGWLAYSLFAKKHTIDISDIQ